MVLDEESAAKYEVFIEELDKEINNNPAEVARMIELLLTEGNANFKKGKVNGYRSTMKI